MRKLIDVEPDGPGGGDRCEECSDPIVLTFESEGAIDDGLDSYAHLSFCHRHALEFVDRLREVADKAHVIVIKSQVAP